MGEAFSSSDDDDDGYDGPNYPITLEIAAYIVNILYRELVTRWKKKLTQV